MLCLKISNSIFIFLMYIVISKSFISRFFWTCCKMVVHFGVQGTSAYFLFEKVVLCAPNSYDWKWVVLTLSKSPLFKIPKSTLATLRDYTVFVTKNLSLSPSLSQYICWLMSMKMTKHLLVIFLCQCLYRQPIFTIIIMVWILSEWISESKVKRWRH